MYRKTQMNVIALKKLALWWENWGKLINLTIAILRIILMLVVRVGKKKKWIWKEREEEERKKNRDWDVARLGGVWRQERGCLHMILFPLWQTFHCAVSMEDLERWKHGVKPDCTLCSKVLFNRRQFARHKKTMHCGQPRHTCQFCSKGFTNKCYIKRHMEGCSKGKSSIHDCTTHRNTWNNDYCNSIVGQSAHAKSWKCCAV